MKVGTDCRSPCAVGSQPSKITATPGIAVSTPSLVGEIVNLVREPDAGNPPVRFDEREVETEHGNASEAPADERAGNR